MFMFLLLLMVVKFSLSIIIKLISMIMSFYILMTGGKGSEF